MTTSSDQPLTRDQALRILRAHQTELEQRFGVVELALFGSTVRDEARPDSDVDLLVTRCERPNLPRYFELRDYVEGICGRKVDLVPKDKLFTALCPYIERETLDVFHPPEHWSPLVPLPKRWDIYVDNMEEACRVALEYTDGFDFDASVNAGVYLDGALHRLQNLGDAMKKVPLEVQERHPEIPWKRMVDNRNLIAHEYYRVDLEEAWALITEVVPDLIPRLPVLKAEAVAELPEELRDT